MFHQLRIRAVLVGIAAGFGVGVIWSIIGAMLFARQFVSAARAGNALASSPAFVLLSLAGAFGSSFVAGWVASRIAVGAETTNAIAVGVVIVLLSAVLFIPAGMDQYPLWYNLPAFALTVPFSYAGGLIHRRNRASNDA